MGQSKKDLRNQEKKKNAALGIVTKQQKAPNTIAKCQLCKLELRTTKRNVELLSHQQSKHPSSSFEECWPGETHE
jgi:ribosomal protein L34E